MVFYFLTIVRKTDEKLLISHLNPLFPIEDDRFDEKNNLPFHQTPELKTFYSYFYKDLDCFERGEGYFDPRTPSLKTVFPS